MQWLYREQVESAEPMSGYIGVVIPDYNFSAFRFSLIK